MQNSSFSRASTAMTNLSIEGVTGQRSGMRGPSTGGTSIQRFSNGAHPYRDGRQDSLEAHSQYSNDHQHQRAMYLDGREESIEGHSQYRYNFHHNRENYISGLSQSTYNSGYDARLNGNHFRAPSPDDESANSSSEFPASTPASMPTLTQASSTRSQSRHPSQTTADARPTSRGSNFDERSLNQLCTSWLHVSQDSATGNDQKSAVFWNKIADDFNLRMDAKSQRTSKSLSARWATLNTSMSKFAACFSQVVTVSCRKFEKIATKTQQGGPCNSGNQAESGRDLIQARTEKIFLTRLHPTNRSHPHPILAFHSISALWFLPRDFPVKSMGYQFYSESIKLLATQMAIDGVALDTINVTLRTKISAVSLWRWKTLYAATNSVIHDPKGYQTRGRPHVLSEEHLAVLYEIVTGNPSIYLDEIQQILLRLSDIPISRATISRELHHRLGLSHLVARGVHSAQSIEDRTAYMLRVGNIPPEYFVFIDESGIRGRDTLRYRCWAPKGGRSVRQQRDNDTEHWTILPAVCEQGMIAGVVHEGPVEQVHVELFLERELLPVMNRYPAVNSVLVLNNARIHHRGIIKQLCRDAGVLLVYLPAYSPDMNPIENCFHSMKAQMRRDNIWFHIEDLSDYILMVAAQVMTRKLLQPLIAFCGYATADYWMAYNGPIDVDE